MWWGNSSAESAAPFKGIRLKSIPNKNIPSKSIPIKTFQAKFVVRRGETG
jgi:hypothetical protein